MKKLTKSHITMISFMLFSMFFGAGNLIFPPFLGVNAGTATLPSFIGFLITAVVLPVMGVVVIAQFDGLDSLAQNVSRPFAYIFTILIYISIGPGLAIPRAASVPFEMSVAPYLPENANLTIWMIAYSLIFFILSCWLCLAPQKLMERLGQQMTPALLILMLVLFLGFLFKGERDAAVPQTAYQVLPFLQGFKDGYQTMDAIAALNFGLVVSTTLSSIGVKEKKDIVGNTIFCGSFAGILLALVYAVLTFMGMESSGVYGIADNGAVTLRQITYQVFGTPGAILLAAIFFLACLTTCVGLINSISLFFSRLYPKVSYKTLVIVTSIFSFLVCNQGLSTILSISVPVLNVLYPISISLILLGLSQELHKGKGKIYPLVIGGVTVISLLYAFDQMKLPIGGLRNILDLIPLYEDGFAWVIVAAVMTIFSLLFSAFSSKNKN